MLKKIKSHWDEQWVKLDTKYPTVSKDYYFSNYGRLKSVDKETEAERLLNGTTTMRGYKQLYVKSAGNKSTAYSVHKEVAEAFVKRDHEDQKFVLHLDQDKANNHYENLRWVNQKELTEFHIEKGIYHNTKRKRSPAYKMNPAKVKMLKKMLKEGKTKKKILARQFNITPEQLRKIEKGIDWAWVKLDDEEQED